MTTRYVVDHARYVAVDLQKVALAADNLAARQLSPVTYDCDRQLCGPELHVATFVLVLDTLNFSFWPDPEQPRWRVTDRGETRDGYWALVAALRRALAEGIPLDDANYLAQLSDPAVAKLLRGEGTIPLLSERAAALRELGQGLRDRFGGEAINLIARADHDALRLTALLAQEFRSFADVATYHGQPIQFYKRAQICCGDLAGASQGAPWGALKNLDQLTAFADYRVPQVLRGLGILVYADELADQVDRRLQLQPGSEPEIEIRAGTIWGVEYLRRSLAERGLELAPYQLDWYLWELGQSLPADAQPYHLTRTIYY